jgi:hypothetical protein
MQVIRLFFMTLVLAAVLMSDAAAEEKKKVLPIPLAVQPTLRQVLQNKYMDFLKKEGFAPQIDEDGDILFKFEGYSYYIQVNDDDEQFFRIMLTNIWPITSPEEMNNVLIAADYSNSTSKTAKIFVVRNDVWISAELLIENPDSYEKVFLRALRLIQVGRNNFEFKMSELNKPGSVTGQTVTPPVDQAEKK